MTTSLRLLAAISLVASLMGCQQPAPTLPAHPLLVTSNLPPVYSPDAGPGEYKNPIVFADYSDPDVCRVGDDYYMTASSFSNFPGLPILHSTDLVHWALIGHALVRYPAPLDKNFDAPAHGAGVWAPAIRYHNGAFYIFFGDPDLGVFMTKTKDPAGTWDPLVRVKEAKGWIDTCPLWDDDGKVYLVHAFANSRAGIANVLDVCRLSPDATRVLDDNPTIPGPGAALGTRIYDGGQPTRPAATAFTSAPKYTTVEGPKFYKRNGYYYIMSPGGGVTSGYQLVFRSKNVLGPYESRIVLDQGATRINGPHQGGWVDTPSGENWFIHFQEVLPYGRILHLQPATWVNDWPVMGNAAPGAEKGQPVLTHTIPTATQRSFQSLAFGQQEGLNLTPRVPQTSDEFNAPTLGLQWQWWANFKPEWADLTSHPGFLRLSPVALGKPTPLYNRPNLLTQKFPAETFTVTTKLDASTLVEGESAGLVLAGKTMASLTVTRTSVGTKISCTTFNAPAANNNPPLPASAADTESASATLPSTTLYLRMQVAPRGICTFSFSPDNTMYTDLGRPVTAINATWIGAKVGLFANAAPNTQPTGHADFDFFHVEP